MPYRNLPPGSRVDAACDRMSLFGFDALARLLATAGPTRLLLSNPAPKPAMQGLLRSRAACSVTTQIASSAARCNRVASRWHCSSASRGIGGHAAKRSIPSSDVALGLAPQAFTLTRPFRHAGLPAEGSRRPKATGCSIFVRTQRHCFQQHMRMRRPIQSSSPGSGRSYWLMPFCIACSGARADAAHVSAAKSLES